MPRFTDTLPSLDARTLKRAGLLTSGASTSLAWTNGATIRATVNDAGDVLTLAPPDKTGHAAPDAGETVPLESHPNTKGSRLWFRCPGCDRRCAVLHGAGGHWRCRRCLNLTYRTVYSDPAARAVRRCQTIRGKLGATDAAWQTVPARPFNMHGSTYRRLTAELAGWQGRARALCLDGLGRAA